MTERGERLLMNSDINKQVITALLEGLTTEQIKQVRDIVMSMYLENEEENDHT